MKQLQPIIWSKGTFLTPQHLQIQDRFLESLMQFRMESLNFRPWGFRELRINQEELAAGNFALSRATGIFSDGLPFEIPDSDAAPPPKPLATYFEADVDRLDIHLAIPNYLERGVNISAGRGNVDARYLAEVALIRDENTGRAEKPVQVARKNFRLLVEGEARHGASTLRVASVVRTPAGLFELDPRFVPPVLDLAASDYLVAILRRLVEILTAKSGLLSGLRRQRNQSLADFTAGDIANFWLLYTVNTHLPILRHLFETKRGHPEALYSNLLSLAGALCTFSLRTQPRDLPLYDHDDLGHCCTDLDEKLRELLETVVPSNFVSLPLKLQQTSIYATAIADEKYLKDTKMYLAVSSDKGEADMIKDVPKLIKLCSASQIDQLVRQAMPGIQLTHMTAPPSAIPVKLKFQYYSLNQSGVAWDSVRKARNLAAYVPDDFPNPQLELLILLPQTA